MPPILSLPSFASYRESEAVPPESSMLAREAFRAGVSLHSARKALRDLYEGQETNESGLKFLSHFFCMAESDQALLRESIS
jgi:hypothetical protein